MITRADIGDYGFLLVMLIFGLINWLANKVKEGKAAPPPPRPVTRAPRPSDTAPQTRTAEEERMRRFLEALGVPAEEAPPPPAPAAQPPRPRPAPVARRVAPAPPPLPPAEHSLDEEDTTSEPVERIRLPELKTDTMPEFETVSSRVSADPDGEFRTASARISAVPLTAPVAEAGPAPETVSRELLAALRTPASLRHALILREILGPPRSLQRN